MREKNVKHNEWAYSLTAMATLVLTIRSVCESDSYQMHKQFSDSLTRKLFTTLIASLLKSDFNCSNKSIQWKWNFIDTIAWDYAETAAQSITKKSQTA